MARAQARSAIVAGAVLATIAAVGACGRSPTLPRPPDGELVRGGFGTGFAWASGSAPTLEVAPVDGAALRRQVARAQAAVRADADDQFNLALVATFPTTAEADAEAASLRDRLTLDDAWFAEPAHASERTALLEPDREAPISEPASAWLRDANLAPGSRGFGWAGRAAGSGDPADAVWTVGSTVFVTGLKAEMLASAVPPPVHPIAHRWAAAGADVLLEGDDAGDGTILTDLSCQPANPTSGAALRDAIGDTIDLVQWSALPPWAGRPTPAQADARVQVATYQRIAQSVATDPAITALMTRIVTASEAERAALLATLGERIAAGVHQAAAGHVSPDILELMDRQPRGADDLAALESWQREVGERIGTVELRPGGGAPTADAAATLALFGTARLRDGRLEVGSLALGRVTTGLPLVIAWLDEAGCRDQRLGFTDGDP